MQHFYIKKLNLHYLVANVLSNTVYDAPACQFLKGIKGYDVCKR